MFCSSIAQSRLNLLKYLIFIVFKQIYHPQVFFWPLPQQMWTFLLVTNFFTKLLDADKFDLPNTIEQRIVDWLASNFKKDEGIELLKDKQALQRLTEAAEKAKMELSTLTQTSIR